MCFSKRTEFKYGTSQSDPFLTDCSNKNTFVKEHKAIVEGDKNEPENFALELFFRVPDLLLRTGGLRGPHLH